MRSCLAVLLIAVSAVLAGAAPAWAETRVALVIANARYASVADLNNPPNDGADVAEALGAAGFEVERIEDAGFDAMRRALAAFGDRAARADVAVVYFAGHGLEIDRQNYLLPVDARLADALDVAFEGVPLDLVRRAAQPAARLSLVIVDACRTNPFVESMVAEGRSLSRGLGRVAPAGQNALVAFAAREGTIAEDGSGRNSPYAAALSVALAEPGLEIGKLFRQVRDDVLRNTRGRQEPALYGSLSAEDFYFVPPDPVAAAAPRGLALAAPVQTAGSVAESPAPARQGKPAHAPGGAVDLAFWSAIAASTDARDFEDYLVQFPGGTFAGLARRRLEELGRAVPDETAPAAATASVPATAPATAPAEAPERIALATPAEAPAPEADDAPGFRASRDQVRDVQARLTILGFDPGPTDGLMGRRTAGAIEIYQRRNALAVDGAVTAALIERLISDVPQPRLAAWYAEQEAARLAARRAEEERRRQQAAARAATAPAIGDPAPVTAPSETAAAPATGDDDARKAAELRRRCEWLDSTGNAWSMRECQELLRPGIKISSGGGSSDTGNPAERINRGPVKDISGYGVGVSSGQGTIDCDALREADTRFSGVPPACE